MKMDVIGIDVAKDVLYRMDLGMMTGVMLLILTIGIEEHIALSIGIKDHIFYRSCCQG